MSQRRSSAATSRAANRRDRVPRGTDVSASADSVRPVRRLRDRWLGLRAGPMSERQQSRPVSTTLMATATRTPVHRRTDRFRRFPALSSLAGLEHAACSGHPGWQTRGRAGRRRRARTRRRCLPRDRRLRHGRRSELRSAPPGSALCATHVQRARLPTPWPSSLSPPSPARWPQTRHRLGRLSLTSTPSSLRPVASNWLTGTIDETDPQWTIRVTLAARDARQHGDGGVRPDDRRRRAPAAAGVRHSIATIIPSCRSRCARAPARRRCCRSRRPRPAA